MAFSYGGLSLLALSHFFLIEDIAYCFASPLSDIAYGSEEYVLGMTNVSDSFTSVIFLYMLGFT